MANGLHHCLSGFVIVRVSPKSMRGGTVSPEDCGTDTPGHGMAGGLLSIEISLNMNEHRQILLTGTMRSAKLSQKA